METGEPLNVGWRNGVPKRFAAYHAADRNFFLLFLVLCWLGVIGGFMPSVTKRLAGNADYAAPLVLQVHVFAFTAWLLLLGMQMALIRWRRPAVHKQLGLAAIILIPIMSVTALWSEIYSQQFYFDHPPNSQAFFIVPIANVIAFTILASAALVSRKDASTHKRLILLATTVIAGVGYSRWWGEGLYAAFGDGLWGMIINTYTGTNLLLAGAVAYDLVTRKRVHRVYEIGVPMLLLSELAVSLIYHAPEWLPVARYLIGR